MKLGHRHSLSKSANNATATDWPPSAPHSKSPFWRLWRRRRRRRWRVKCLTAASTLLLFSVVTRQIKIESKWDSRDWGNSRRDTGHETRHGTGEWGTGDGVWEGCWQADADADTGTCWCRCRSPKLTKQYVGLSAYLSVRPTTPAVCVAEADSLR